MPECSFIDPNLIDICSIQRSKINHRIDAICTLDLRMPAGNRDIIQTHHTVRMPSNRGNIGLQQISITLISARSHHENPPPPSGFVQHNPHIVTATWGILQRVDGTEHDCAFGRMVKHRATGRAKARVRGISMPALIAKYVGHSPYGSARSALPARTFCSTTGIYKTPTM